MSEVRCVEAGTSAAAQADRQAIIETVKLLHPGRVVELRVLNLDGRGYTASGYFDQPDALALAALRYNRRAEGVYLTLNALPGSLLGRADNRVVERGKDTTKDAEVQRRVWLPIDLDPVRPSGISASSDEHQAALEQARRVREWLSSEWGWHAPIFADSGNGAHLLYAIDLPNDAESADLLKRCLAALASRFDTPAVALDRSVYNAARIWKLYGSVARKGASIAARPHRLAQIINAPDPVELVTREQLETLAGMAPVSANGRPHPPANEFAPKGSYAAAKSAYADSSPLFAGPDSQEGVGRVPEEGLGGGTPLDAVSPKGGTATAGAWGGRVTEADLLAWLEQQSAVVRQTKQKPDYTVYVLERCPFNADHHEPGKACVTLSEEGWPGFKCQAAGCAEHDWQELKAIWGDLPHAPPGAARDGGATSAASSVAPASAPASVPLVAPASVPAPGGDGRALAFGAARPWPYEPLPPVYYGLAGEIVETILPHTEADPVAILVQLLTAFGAAIGPGPHFKVGTTRHQPRLFSVIVGKSAKARKGDSWQGVREVLERSGVAPRLQTSLSSGEGLIWLVRDPIIRTKLVPGRGGQQSHYEQVVEDEGESEKRVLVVSSEMAQIFKVLRREGNTLSAIIRDAWDQGNLSIATRSLAARATGVYLSMIGHITVDELRQELNSLDAANGFANRFCWFAVRRDKQLARPAPLSDQTLERLATRFREAVERARQIDTLDWDDLAGQQWDGMYARLGRERGGFAGALISRSEAQTLRLSMLYALLDGSPRITYRNLQSGTELWSYAERSIEYLFGGLAGNPLAEKIAGFLKERGPQSRSQLYNLLNNHVPSGKIAEALGMLAAQGKAAGETRQTGGKTAEVWQWLED